VDWLEPGDHAFGQLCNEDGTLCSCARVKRNLGSSIELVANQVLVVVLAKRFCEAERIEKGPQV
jgi:hypothetical protein